MNIRKICSAAAVALMGAAMLSCNSIAKESSPVQLIVSGTQNINQVDLQANAPGCGQPIGTVEMRVQLLQNQADPLHPVNNSFNDVRITRYQVSYQRTDGGKLVPQPFVRSTAQLLTAGTSANALSDFQAFETNAFNLAPFVALLPINGGHDPETGLPYVKMDLILDVFGETLAGERVSGEARFPLNFCYNCGGCF